MWPRGEAGLPTPKDLPTSNYLISQKSLIGMSGLFMLIPDSRRNKVDKVVVNQVTLGCVKLRIKTNQQTGSGDA